MITSRPPLFVVTGGPCSGKTTLVEALAVRGFTTVPEAAMDVISRLNEDLGARAQRAWRRDHLAEFQERILALQIQRERGLSSGPAPAFLDRGIADGIAYFENAGLEPPRHLVEAAIGSGYARAFVLDTLEPFRERRSSGRGSGRDDSVRLGGILARVYERIGVPVTRLRCASVEERMAIVLDVVGMDPI